MPRDWSDRPRAKPSPVAQYVLGGVAALVTLGLVIGVVGRCWGSTHFAG
ncbi:MAG TPA: hypothetical protein VF695_06250 [Sphingomonas sp.]